MQDGVFYSKEPIKMNRYLTFSIEKLIEISVPLAIFIVTLIFGSVPRKLIFVRLTRWSKRTETGIDDIIITSTREPFIIWFLMLGLYFSQDRNPMVTSSFLNLNI